MTSRRWPLPWSSACQVKQIRFYTGVPDPRRDGMSAFWHGFWSNKLRYLRSRPGVYVYRGRVNPGGQEKSVDVSLAVAKQIAQNQGRQLVFESAFPYRAGPISPRGVPGTVWFHIDKALYDSCFDPTDYRP